MNSTNISIEVINEQNSLFWHRQSKLTLTQLADAELFASAQLEMNSELDRGVPVRSRKTLEDTLGGIAEKRKTIRSGFSRKGGEARKCDALQAEIEDIVKRRPMIAPGQLLHELGGGAGAGTITSIESETDVLADEGRRIYFVTYDGRAKTALVSALRYRLVRAKRKINNEH